MLRTTHPYTKRVFRIKKTDMQKLRLIGLLLLAPLMLLAQTTIYDIQYVDPNGGTDASPLLNQSVTVSGIITATTEANNLGDYYMQQADLTEWAGIRLEFSPELLDLTVGDEVTISGTVKEISTITVLGSISAVEVTGSGTILPTPVDPNLFTNYSLAENEQYEGMLIALQAAPGLITVVNNNPDDPSNFGEWRVGSDPGDPDAGCHILTGRQTSSIISSLYVSYINDLQWVDNSGNLQVPPIVVQNGDTFFAIVGISTYFDGNNLLLPRNNDDIILEAPNALSSLPKAKLFQLQIAPNPVSETAVLSFVLPQKMSVRALLYNQSGILVAELAQWPALPTGTHEQVIEIPAALASGSYLLKLEGQNHQEISRLLVYR